MFKGLIVSLLSLFLLFACTKKGNKEIVSEETEEEMAIEIYADALEALKAGDAFYAGKKFREVESLLPQSKWAAKSSLWPAIQIMRGILIHLAYLVWKDTLKIIQRTKI